MLKAVGNIAMTIIVFIAICAIPFLLVKGSVWASDNLLQPLIGVGWLVLAINLLIALPVSIFRRTRMFAGIVILLSSFVFGLIAWLTGFVITYSYWGLVGVVLGLLVAGIGLVPLGLLAGAFHGWNGTVPLLVLIALTYGSRLAGALLATSGEQYRNKRRVSAFDSLIDKRNV